MNYELWIMDGVSSIENLPKRIGHPYECPYSYLTFYFPYASQVPRSESYQASSYQSSSQ